MAALDNQLYLPLLIGTGNIEENAFEVIPGALRTKTFDGGSVTLIAAAGGASVPVTLQYVPEVTSFPAGLKVFSISASGAWDFPLSARVRYPAEVEEHRLGLFRYNVEQSAWVEIPSQVDSGAVVGLIEQQGRFALMNDAPCDALFVCLEEPAAPAAAAPLSFRFVRTQIDPVGNALVQVEITGDVMRARITGGAPGQLAVPLAHTPAYGADVWTAIFSDIPNNQVIDFTITAEVADGGTASLEGSLRGWNNNHQGVDCILSTCGGWVPEVGEGVLAAHGSLFYRLPLLNLAGPGESDIDLFLTYHSQGQEDGWVGRGWFFSYGMTMRFVDTPLLRGAEIRYPDGRLVRFAITSSGVFAPVDPDIHDRLEQTVDGYRLTRVKTLISYLFDAAGRLTGLHDRNQNPVRLIYEGERLVRIENNALRIVTLTYNERGQIASISAGDRQVLLAYEDDRLTAVTGPNSGVWQFAYETRSTTGITGPSGQDTTLVDQLLTVWTDPAGAVQGRQIYDEMGRVIEQTVAGSEKRTFTYDEVARETAVADAYGNITRYRFDALWRLVEQIAPDGTNETYGYDDDFNRTYLSDGAEREWRWTYNASGSLLREEGPLGWLRTWEYDPLGLPVRATERLDAAVTRQTLFTYDAVGNLRTITNPLGAVADYRYDERGLLTRAQDFAGRIIYYTYNNRGDLTSRSNGLETTFFQRDDAGRLSRVTLPEGQVYTYSYTPTDRIQTVIGPLGFALNYVYDLAGNFVAETDPTGAETRYSVDAAGRVTAEIGPDESRTEFVYGAMGELIRSVDAEGRAWEYRVDSMLRLIEESGPLGFKTQYTYDSAGNRVTVTDAEGRVQRTEYDALDRPISVTENDRPGEPADSDTNLTTTYAYDLGGRLLESVDPEGNPTTYAYDLLDRLTGQTNAEGGQWVFAYDAAGNLLTATSPRGAVTGYVYDYSNRLLSVTDAYGSVTRYEYNSNGWQTASVDPVGTVTAYQYDDLGRATAEIRNAQEGQPPSAQVNVTTGYEFDLAGRLLAATNPGSSRAVYTYDSAGRLLEAADYAGAVTRYSYDRVGNLLSITDPNGGVTRYSVDELNRRTAITNPEEHTIQYSYNLLDELTAIKDANGGLTTFTRDGAGRVRKQTDAEGGVWRLEYNRADRVIAETNPNESTRRYSYDRIYRPLTYTAADGGVTQYGWDADSNLISLIDPLGRPAAYEYDLLNRLTAFTLPSGAVERYAYDSAGSRTAKIDADGITTRYEYDPLYRLIAVTQNFTADAPETADQNVITRYAYDPSGGLTEITNPLGAITRFERDAMGRPVREINPLGSEWKYTWDGAGNLTSRLDPDGTLTEYSYYPDHMLRQVEYPDETVTFAYDRSNNRVSMNDSLGKSRWEYDALNRLTRAEDSLGRRIKLGYDAAGNRVSLTYPNNYKVRWQYDAENRMTAMIDPAGRETLYRRDLAGSISGIQYPNEVTAEFTYTPDAQIASLIYQREDRVTAGFAYVYSPAGDVNQLTILPEGAAEQYAYDPLHRLTGVESTAGETAGNQYDAAGNRVLWSGSDNPFTEPAGDAFQVAATYNAASLLTQMVTTGTVESTITYAYDASGNRTDQRVETSDGPLLGMHYEYDAENRLAEAQAYQIVDHGRTSNRGQTTYDYDGLGRLLLQQYNPQNSGSWSRTETLYDGLDPIAEYYLRSCRWTYLYRGADNALTAMQRFPTDSSGRNLDGSLGLYDDETLGSSCGVEDAGELPLDAGDAPTLMDVGEPPLAEELAHDGGKGSRGNTYWYLLNARGDVVGLTKSEGQLVNKYRYDPYGSPLPEDGIPSTSINRFTFSGKRLDEHTGLVYFGARHYDPFSGVWLTQDLWRGDISDPISLNRTLFANANPLSLRDEYGFQPELVNPSGAAQLQALLADPLARRLSSADANTSAGVFIQHHFYSAAGASYAVPEYRLEGTNLYFDLNPSLPDDNLGLDATGRLFGRFAAYGIEPVADGKLASRISTQQQVYQLGFVEPGITGYHNVESPAMRLPGMVEVGRSGLLMSFDAFNRYGGEMDAAVNAGAQVLNTASAFTGCPADAVGVSWGCVFATPGALYADILPNGSSSGAACTLDGSSGICLSGTLNGRTLSREVFTVIYNEPDMCLVRKPEPRLPRR